MAKTRGGGVRIDQTITLFRHTTDIMYETGLIGAKKIIIFPIYFQSNNQSAIYKIIRLVGSWSPLCGSGLLWMLCSWDDFWFLCIVFTCRLSLCFIYTLSANRKKDGEIIKIISQKQFLSISWVFLVQWLQTLSLCWKAITVHNIKGQQTLAVIDQRLFNWNEYFRI